MTTTTRPTPVLTRAQYDELWKMFCRYGRLREQQGQMFGTHHPADEYAAKAAEADAAQERFGALLASLTVAEAVSGE